MNELPQAIWATTVELIEACGGDPIRMLEPKAEALAAQLNGLLATLADGLGCSECDGTGWTGICDCDPDREYQCYGTGSCGQQECQCQK